MQRAATTPTMQHSSKRTIPQPISAPGQITAAQVWPHLSATQQQALQRALTNACRDLITGMSRSTESEEAHDDDES